MRILELADRPYLKGIRPEEVDFYYIGKKTSSPEPRLTWADYWRLRRELRAGHYDLVCLTMFATSGPIWRPSSGVISNSVRILRQGLKTFHAFGPQLVEWLLRGCDVPLVVLDRKDDPNKLMHHLHGLLARASAYYWREQPVKIEHGFLFTHPTLEDTSAIRRNSVFRQHQHKIRPISLGVPWRTEYDSIPEQPEKIWDIFYAGSTNGSRVREEGLAQLRQLEAEGLKVLAQPEATYPIEEFLRLCSQARLVWSPQGHGWDCYRHYEVCLARSIPVMNYPTIRRHAPLIDHEHAFYYAPEGNDLARVVRRALALDRSELRRIAALGRDHVRQHHLEERIYEQIVREHARSSA